MTHLNKSGNKGFGGTTGATHTIYVYNITETKQIKKQGISSYSQTVIPQTILQGRQPDTIKIEGKLCKVSEVTQYLNALSGYRSVNTLYNVFLPCSILIGSSTNCPEINGNWIVDTFKIKRNLQKRDLVLFELVLNKWYEALVA